MDMRDPGVHWHRELCMMEAVFKFRPVVDSFDTFDVGVV